MNKKFLEDDATDLKKPKSPMAPAPGKAGLDPAAAKEADSEDVPAAPEDEAPDAGDDADKDSALFKQLIQKSLGTDEEPSESLMSAAKEMHQSAMESGMTHEEAMMHAGAGLKMAKIMGDKHKPSEASDADDDVPPAAKKAEKAPPPPAPKAPAAKAKPAAAPADEDCTEGKKESITAQLARLSGENAKLRESIKKGEITTHLDKILKESGFSTLVTKAFRDLVKNSKSVEEINASWKAFKPAVESVKEAGRISFAETAFSFAPEKVAVNTESSESGSDLKSGFTDCVSE